MVLLVGLVVAAGFLAHYILVRKQPLSSVVVPVEKPSPPDRSVAIPRFEVYPDKEVPPPPRPAKPPIHTRPQVAIILDDLGYDREIARKFLALDANLTFSILPHSPHSRAIARDAQKNGTEIMLHLPMEPLEYPAVDPGPGALLARMKPDELIRQLEINLDDVPYVQGVNNHMGSRLTTESNQIYQIFTILKKRKLFFIDSRSTAATLCRPSARLFKIPFAERDVFIDHEHHPEFIRKQLKQLIALAKQRGEAIGIAHPSRITYDVLQKMLPELKKSVQLVPASKLVHVIS
jgi:polysaccharide deacetylase 2 family uncharacterized protein YibQ